MRLRSQWWRVWAIVVLVVVVGALAACQSSNGDGEEQTIDAQALLEDRCTECHDLGRVTSQSKTRAEWDATVEAMIERGAVLNAQEKEVLVDYLAEEYGP